jgi:hypothetical protein
VPFHFLAPFRPFEIELGMMEFHVGADEIGSDVGDWRLDHKLPISGMMLDRARKAPQPWFLESMSWLQVEDCIGFLHRAAALHHFSSDRAQPLYPLTGHCILHEQIAVGEVAFLLLLRQDARRLREHLFRGHGVTS